ncbi:MAG: imidazoleglycerol-phosphate dehydratase, partial [Spirochaetota bacterium]
MDSRSASVKRATQETEISLSLELLSLKESVIHTGVPFFDHMIAAFSRHGRMALDVTCKGDT